MAGLQIFPADKHVEAQYVEMKVPLYSYGCEKKIKKALSHMRGIHSVHVDYHLQKVTVWGICNKDDVLATIRKKRREARFWDQMEPEVKTRLLRKRLTLKMLPILQLQTRTSSGGHGRNCSL